MKSYNSKIANNDKVEFIHYSMDESEEDALGWAKSSKLPWPHILPKNTRKSGLSKYNRESMANLYVLIDKNGKVIASDKAEAFKKIANLAD